MPVALSSGYRFVLLIFCFHLCQPVPLLAEEGARALPFLPGEKLTYNLNWGFIPAGEAALEILPVTEIDGVPAHHFLLTASSNAFIDPFYKVRDRVESFTDIDVTRSLYYKKKQREGSTRNDLSVEFNWTAQTARQTNFGKARASINIPPGTLDPLAVFFYTRKLLLQSGLEFSRPVTDGNKCVIGQARIVKRETITVPAGDFDTYLMEPDLKDVGGVFAKSKNATLQIWVTADHRQMLVKLKSKVRVGSFVGELRSVENALPVHTTER
jgi:hypothetical protein